MKTKKKTIGAKNIGNRTIIGLICIVAALAICFGVAPLVNRVSDGKTEIVRVTSFVLQGSSVGESDIEVVKVGSHNLPTDVIRDKSHVIGKFATTDLYVGDYLLPGKLTSDGNQAKDILGTLDGGQKAISVTIDSFAQGLSGKIDSGDVISTIVYSSKDGVAFTPPELQYIKVVTSTTSKGVDKADIADSTQPVTVTLLVNKEQAELLAQYEKTASIHFALEYRGDSAVAQKYLDIQNDYFKTKGA